ncbi:hypothetical protein NDU88_001226 [Pleurodeles waltl]|uniref:Uncharacterized protein n=1 Tax=Pleurodeles waltl TaxID=8319 RepID=A0AAV7W0F2_PLEWA|nr:hypothetical protein NDU88_001226 [Pleurodeles waltl]
MEPAEWEGAPAVPMPLAWALQGPPGAPRHPIPPSCSWRANRQEQDGGMRCQNPHGGAASCATMADSHGQRKVGGTPPAFRFWPRLYRRGQNARRCTASLLAVLPPTSALAVFTARVRMTPLILNGQDPEIPGVYYICGKNAYYRLLRGW